MGTPMENHKLAKDGAVEGPISGPATSNLLHHVSAISRALKNWNDTEALKLLRLHWPEISRALRKQELLKGIPIIPFRVQIASSFHGSFDTILTRLESG